MERAIEDADTQLRAVAAFQLHKSLGLSILALSVLRLAWRLFHPPPPLPPGTPAWQRRAAVATHWIFYVLMLAIPLAGWLLVSAQWRDGAALNVPTLWFGWFQVPHLFGLDEATDAVRSALAEGAGEVHEWLAWGALALLALHVGAALKHHFIDRDEVLASMSPGVVGRSMPEKLILVAGALGIIAAIVAIVAALLRIPLGSVAFRVLDEPVVALPQDSVTAATAGRWVFAPGAGRVQFSGTHAGSEFSGSFGRWRATLEFDPSDLSTAALEAEIDTGSAETGNSLYDDTLPGKEWFDVAGHPLSRYRSSAISKDPEGGYLVKGTLTLKGREHPVRLRLRFGTDGPSVTGRFEIDRVDADLGMESDPNAEFVGHTVLVQVHAKGKASR